MHSLGTVDVFFLYSESTDCSLLTLTHSATISAVLVGRRPKTYEETTYNVTQHDISRDAHVKTREITSLKNKPPIVDFIQRLGYIARWLTLTFIRKNVILVRRSTEDLRSVSLSGLDDGKFV